MKCEHCGFEEPDKPVILPMKLENWPAGVPTPPQPPPFRLHGDEGCPSDLKIGDDVCWGLHGHIGPVYGTVVQVVAFDGPQMVLEPGGEWLVVKAPRPAVVRVKLDRASVLAEHRAALPDLAQAADEIQIFYGALTPTAKWPMVS